MGVELAGGIQGLREAVEGVAGGRYQCHLEPEEPRDFVVVEPADVPEVEVLRRRWPSACVVVWDRREPASPSAVASALGAGVDAYVTSGSAHLLVAHLDALARRTRSVEHLDGTPEADHSST